MSCCIAASVTVTIISPVTAVVVGVVVLYMLYGYGYRGGWSALETANAIKFTIHSQLFLLFFFPISCLRGKGK